MFPKINPKQMQKMMQQMGMRQEEIEADEVIIKRSGSQLVFKNPQVSKISMGGQDTYQVVGDFEEKILLSKNDIQTVMEQTGVSEKEAKKSLEDADGDLAEAIVSLKKEKIFLSKIYKYPFSY